MHHIMKRECECGCDEADVDETDGSGAEIDGEKKKDYMMVGARYRMLPWWMGE